MDGDTPDCVTEKSLLIWYFVFRFDKHATIQPARRSQNANASRFSGLLAGLLAESVGLSLCLLAISLPLQKVDTTHAALSPVKKPTFQQYASQKIQSDKQFKCLSQLYEKESGWNHLADNPRSTAFGIGQLLGETSTDGYVQIDNSLKYIAHRYGLDNGYVNACKAWQHFKARNWH